MSNRLKDTIVKIAVFLSFFIMNFLFVFVVTVFLVLVDYFFPFMDLIGDEILHIFVMCFSLILTISISAFFLKKFNLGTFGDRKVKFKVNTNSADKPKLIDIFTKNSDELYALKERISAKCEAAFLSNGNLRKPFDLFVTIYYNTGMIKFGCV